MAIHEYTFICLSSLIYPFSLPLYTNSLLIISILQKVEFCVKMLIFYVDNMRIFTVLIKFIEILVIIAEAWYIIVKDYLSV